MHVFLSQMSRVTRCEPLTNGFGLFQNGHCFHQASALLLQTGYLVHLGLDGSFQGALQAIHVMRALLQQLRALVLVAIGQCDGMIYRRLAFFLNTNAMTKKSCYFKISM